MTTRVCLTIALALAISARALVADAANYNLVATGASVASVAATNCGALLSDAYDTFCPSDPGGNSTCQCDSFSANITGNKVGTVTDLSGTLHVTVDNGAAVDTPDCQPIFGELSFAASKDTETIYFNGARCDAFPGAGPVWQGGWGTFSSTSSLKALGTLTMTLNAAGNAYTLKLAGKTQP